MVDRAALGAVGSPFELEVERGKIREFARATFSDNAAYYADPAVAPPTFLTTAAFWAEGDADTWSRVQMDQRRGLHAEQEFVFHGPPPRSGQRLVGTSVIKEIYDRQGRKGGTLTFVVMVTEFRDADGRLVAEARLTGVETERPPGDEP